MRAIALALTLSLLALPQAGCFVLDEVDKSAKLMDDHSPRHSKRHKRKNQAKQRRQKGKQDEGMVARIKRWVDEGANLPEPDVFAEDDVLMRCDLPGGSEYLRKNDCELKGGAPAPLSGSTAGTATAKSSRR
jgi:hypothetical protein